MAKSFQVLSVLFFAWLLTNCSDRGEKCLLEVRSEDGTSLWFSKSTYYDGGTQSFAFAHEGQEYSLEIRSEKGQSELGTYWHVSLKRHDPVAEELVIYSNHLLADKNPVGVCKMSYRRGSGFRVYLGVSSGPWSEAVRACDVARAMTPRIPVRF